MSLGYKAHVERMHGELSGGGSDDSFAKAMSSMA
jgi:hypothetical protein